MSADLSKVTWVRVRAAAERLGVSQTTLRLWLRQKRLPYWQSSFHSHIRIDARELEAFAARAKDLAESIGTGQVAAMLRCSESAVTEMARRGTLPTLQTEPGAEHRFRIADVRTLIENSAKRPSEPIKE